MTAANSIKKLLHFSEEEFLQRRNRALELMKRENLDGFLVTRQESLYYLTGFDTAGYVYFQAMYFHIDGSMRLITRIPDLRQALYTSVLTEDEIIIRPDIAGLSPVALVPTVLEQFGINSTDKRIGYEPDSITLSHSVGKLLDDALKNCCTLIDYSNLFSLELRLFKSSAEMRKIRKAAYLADFALARVLKAAKPGAYEGDLWRELNGTIYEGGGEEPALRSILGSGSKAVLTRYAAGRARVERQLTLEYGSSYQHYHACLMRTLYYGGYTKLAKRMFDVNIMQMEAVAKAMRPGKPMSDVFDAYANIADENGFHEQRLNSCGYSMGATFPPNWMDFPMFVKGQSVIMQEGMVFFVHIILLDKATETASSIGHTFEVTKDGGVPLSKMPFCFTRKQTLAAWKKIKKSDYGFSADEEEPGENIRDIELSEDEFDEDDKEI